MRTSLPMIAALALLAAAPLQAGNGGPANRLVGVWSSEGLLGPCGSTPTQPIRATIMFNAGGTVNEIPLFPPGGVNGQVRTNALGTWDYVPRRKLYRAVFQFDWYANGVYAGYQVVEREMRMDGDEVSGAVTSVRYAADGSVMAAICGEASSSRL